MVDRCRSFDHGGDADRRAERRGETFLKSAENAPAWANCAILCTDNALMKHCPCSTPIEVSPASCLFILSLFLSLSLSRSLLSFFLYFHSLSDIGRARDTRSERVPRNKGHKGETVTICSTIVVLSCARRAVILAGVKDRPRIF